MFWDGKRKETVMHEKDNGKQKWRCGVLKLIDDKDKAKKITRPKWRRGFLMLANSR
jgi:hypothetical protein